MCPARATPAQRRSDAAPMGLVAAGRVVGAGVLDIHFTPGNPIDARTTVALHF